MGKDKSTNTLPCVKTDWYDGFRCVGGECPYTCCGGYWGITVDEKTDQKYRALTGEFAEKLNGWIDRSQKPARMELNVLGRCGMLTPDGWCSVQRNLGEEYLCDTCRTYPRKRVTSGGILRFVLTDSCPAVAKNLLTRETPIELVTGDARPERGETAPKTDKNAYAALLTSIHILQDRVCPIAQRQKLFLMFHQALRDASGDQKTTQELLDFFSSPTNYRALAAERDKCDLVSKLRLLKGLCQPLLKDLPSIQTTALFEEILGVILSGADTVERTQPYLERWNEGNYAIAQENILVNAWLIHYLDERCGDCFAQAVYIVVMDQLLRIFVSVGSAQNNEQLALDEQVKYLAFLSRGFEHSGERKKQVSQLLADEGMAELPFLFRLIS